MGEVKKRAAILGAFLDTLVLNVVPDDGGGVPMRRHFADTLKRGLDNYKVQAQAEDEDVLTAFSFQGCAFVMSPKGGKGFYWIMHNTKMSIALTRNTKRMLWAQVRLSSEYLWSVRDLGKVLNDVYIFLTEFFSDQYIKLVPSALDMAVDLANLDWGTIGNIKESFITRAQLDSDHVSDVGAPDGFIDGPDTIHRRWRRLTGFSFGARAAAVSAVIYDKHHEIKYKSKEKEWFIDSWLDVKDENDQPVWDGESPVWRLEMRLRREAINDLMSEGVFHGIDNAFDLEGVLPALWAYLVGHTQGGDDGLPDGWLRYVAPTDDTNRSRWPVHPDWQLVQSAFAKTGLIASDADQEPQEEEVGAPPAPLDLVPLQRRRKRKVNTGRMVAQIAGCLVTLEAWRPVSNADAQAGLSSDLSDTMHYAYELVEEYLKKNDRDFAADVLYKRPLYSIDTAV